MSHNVVRCEVCRPSTWRWVVIAIASLILCSCQAVQRGNSNTEFIVADRPEQASEPTEVVADDVQPDTEQAEQQAQYDEELEPPPAPGEHELQAAEQVLQRPPYLEEPAFEPADLRRDDTSVYETGAVPQRCCPNEIHPWGQPRDEYVCDGADTGAQVRVSGEDFSIRDGLDPSDTIAHFDTLGGKRLVEASSRACVYAPRFAATRKIVHVDQEQLIVRTAPLVGRSEPIAHTENAELGQVKWPQSVDAQVANTIGYALQQHDPARLRENVVSLDEARRQLLPFENLELVRTGSLEMEEQSLLQEGTDAAVAWSSAVQLQVVLEDMPAHVSKSAAGGQDIVVYEIRPGAPQLRLIKLASKCEAQPGETIHFTIRFDNTGNEAIGNVTIIDDLPARLEYVDGSADCSVAHEFVTEPNSAGSQTLQLEITDPLETGEGGVLRFQCLVR